MPRPKSNAWVKKAKKAVKKPKVEIQEPEEDVELQEEASRALSRRVAEERARAKLAARAAEAKEAETDEERFSFAPHPVTWAEAAALDGGDGWCGGADDDDAALALGAEAGGGEADPLGLNAEPASPRRGAGHAALAHAKDFDAVAYLNGAHGAASFAQLEAGWATLEVLSDIPRRAMASLARRGERSSMSRNLGVECSIAFVSTFSVVASICWRRVYGVGNPCCLCCWWRCTTSWCC